MTQQQAKQTAARLNREFEQSGNLSEFKFDQLTKAESILYGYDDFQAGKQIDRARIASFT